LLRLINAVSKCSLCTKKSVTQNYVGSTLLGASLCCALAYGSKEGIFSIYPALIPQRALRTLGNVPGYYRSSREARDWGVAGG
jgi:hypothetical protein